MQTLVFAPDGHKKKSSIELFLIRGSNFVLSLGNGLENEKS